jgi:signal transduction histidine kinase
MISCLNIIDNAVKATPEGGKIIIGTEILNNKATLYIQDFGSGIPPNELGKITEPFYRIVKSRSSNMPGFGLGLSIDSEIVKLHDI